MSEYGLPYMGSKAKICKDIIGLFPKAENFYDLFGGGFSITHAMLIHRSKDFKRFHFNEIRKGICELIQDAVNGKYNYNVFKPKWISRKEFFEKKEIDPYIKICWSFGNNGQDYLFGKDIEEYKKSLHNAVVFNEFNDIAKESLGIERFRDSYSISDRRLFVRYRVRISNKGKIEHLEQLQQIERIQHLEQLQQIERIQQLEQLQQIERIQQLYFYNKSYEEIHIEPNSVIYCDPPYLWTKEYDGNKNFNHINFLNWADSQKNPVFISEYNIADKRFKLVKQIKKRSMLSSNKEKCVDKIEKIYINKAGLKCLKRL